jgi:hypothetical protein
MMCWHQSVQEEKPTKQFSIEHGGTLQRRVCISYADTGVMKGSQCVGFWITVCSFVTATTEGVG